MIISTARLLHVLVLGVFGSVLMSPGWAGEMPEKRRLTSVDQFKRTYVSAIPAESETGIVAFFGWRKDLNPKLRVHEELHVFDRNSLEVWKLRSGPIDTALRGNRGFQSLAITADGTRLAASTRFPDPATSAPYFNIVLIDLKTLDAKTLVGDGKVNHSMSFSPDCRYLAYLSTDRRPTPLMYPDIDLSENAGYLMDLQTRKTRKITEPFVFNDGGGGLMDVGYNLVGPPMWLGDDRVLFLSFATDRAFISKHVSGFSGDACPYWTMADPGSDKIRRLFTPNGVAGAIPDRARKRLFLCDEKRVIQTDYDLNIVREVVRAGDGKKISLTGLKNGEVQYRIYEFPPR